MNTSLDQAVASFVTAVLAEPTASDDDLANALMARGFSRDVSERLIAFVPMTFARCIFEAHGAQFEAGYEIRDPDSGRTKRSLLDNEPIYRAAKAYATRLGIEHPTVELLAGRSAEAQVAEKLLAGGGHLGDIHFTEPVLLRVPLDELPPPNDLGGSDGESRGLEPC